MKHIITSAAKRLLAATSSKPAPWAAKIADKLKNLDSAGELDYGRGGMSSSEGSFTHSIALVKKSVSAFKADKGYTVATLGKKLTEDYRHVITEKGEEHGFVIAYEIEEEGWVFYFWDAS